MTFDRKKWGIKEAIPKTEKPDLVLDESRMVDFETTCKVCNAVLKLKGHSDFANVYEDPQKATGAPEKAIRHILSNVACDWCNSARLDYDRAKEAIGKVVAWLGRNWDASNREFLCDDAKQDRVGKILHSWTRTWSDALRRMKNAPTLVWSHDIGRIVWTRPRAAFTFLAKMEDFLYDPGMSEKQQLQQISNILKWMRGQESELI